MNGVRYETNNASFDIDGESGTQSDLAVGDVVTVAGTIESNGTEGTAESVLFDDIVEGPVSAVDLVANELIVMGQTVLHEAVRRGVALLAGSRVTSAVARRAAAIFLDGVSHVRLTV